MLEDFAEQLNLYFPGWSAQTEPRRPAVESRPLRPRQERALEELRHSLRAGRRRPIVQAPCGWGKTRFAAEIAKGTRAKGKQLVFTVPAISLVDKTIEEFAQEGVFDVGVMQADHPMTNPNMPVQIASIQTLARRGTIDTDLVMVDEAHLMFRAMLRWMGGPAVQNVPFIGLTATPWARGMGKYYDDLIVGGTHRDGVEEGWLKPLLPYGPTSPDMSDVKIVGGEFHEGQTSGKMMPLVGDAVEHWLRLGQRRSTLAYAVDRAHARELERKFDWAGVRTAYVDAFTSRLERSRLERALMAGDLEVIVSIGTMIMGVDLDIGCIVDCQPTWSEIRFVQRAGRGARPSDRYAECIYLDHAGNHERLGFVEDIHHDELSQGKRGEQKVTISEKEEAKAKPCPRCKFIKPPKTRECPKCGFVTQAQSDVKVQDGELVKLKRKQPPTAEEKRQFHAELKGYAEIKGKENSWVLAKYKTKFNEWPSGDPPPAPVSDAVGKWIIAQNIRYAKRRKG